MTMYQMQRLLAPPLNCKMIMTSELERIRAGAVTL